MVKYFCNRPTDASIAKICARDKKVEIVGTSLTFFSLIELIF